MTISETLYAAAKYMRKYGFSPELKRDGCSRCFVGALESASPDAHKACAYLGDCVFETNDGWWREVKLRAECWNTDDAVAALTIAADCAASEGK